jgi:alpha-L-rhamnosidase
MRRIFLLTVIMTCGLKSLVGWASEPAEKNLALGRPCQVFSSYEADGWSKTALTDGKTGTLGWSGKAFSAYENHELYPEYVVVDLGRCARIESVVLHPRGDKANAGKGFPKDFTIQICEEGEPWRKAVEKIDYPSPDDSAPQKFALKEAKGRFVKIEATRLREAEPGRYHFQIAEIEVFGHETAADPLEIKPAETNVLTRVCRLRCENRDHFSGMDAQSPRFSWWMESPYRGQKQTAARILVASSLELLTEDKADLWDSGKMAGDRSVAVVYRGKPLPPCKPVRWKVMLWDKDGKPTKWSDSDKFITGKLKPEDWKGRWIGASEDPQHKPVYLRKEIETGKSVKRATVFFSGLGQSELTIDGRKVGDYLCTPGFTTYDKRVQYLVFDVTDRFAKPGKAALGVVLFDGWYGLIHDPWVHRFHANPYIDKPKLLLDLHLEYEDGTTEVISSDASWQWSYGPIRRAWLCETEIDKRLDMPGWDSAGFAGKGWQGVSLVSGPAGKLVVQKELPLKFVEEIPPERLEYDEAAKTWIYHFNREFSGFVRLRTSGSPGKQVKIVTLPHDPPQVPGRVSAYTFAGEGVEEFRPDFIYSSIMEVRIEGAEKPLSLQDLTGCRISGVGKVSGEFRCSNDLVNWLHESARRSQATYVTYLPIDSSREFKAWMQDPNNMFKSALYMFESQVMYERWQHDILDGQRADGNMPNVAPGAFFDKYTSSWWGGSAVWIPWHWNLYFGDSQLLRESYPGMKKYVDFLGTTAKDSMIEWGLGDWMPVVNTPIPQINTPGYYFWAAIVSQTAKMAGKPEEAKQYAELAERIKSKFNAKFLDRAKGVYQSGTQAAQTLPLALNLVPEDSRKQVEKALLDKIAADHGLVSTGFVSTPYLLEILQDLAPEAGYRMTTTQDYPSWYSMTAGADRDLMMEEWSGKPINMPSLGGNIAGWNMESLGGIRPDPANCGFKNIIVKPNVVGDLHWAECWYDSVRGRIESRWRKHGDTLIMEIIVPANATATIYVPTTQPNAITESGKPISQAEDVTFLRAENGRAIFRVESGRYLFSTGRRFRATKL